METFVRAVTQLLFAVTLPIAAIANCEGSCPSKERQAASLIQKVDTAQGIAVERHVQEHGTLLPMLSLLKEAEDSRIKLHNRILAIEQDLGTSHKVTAVGATTVAPQQQGRLVSHKREAVHSNAFHAGDELGDLGGPAELLVQGNKDDALLGESKELDVGSSSLLQFEGTGESDLNIRGRLEQLENDVRADKSRVEFAENQVLGSVQKSSIDVSLLQDSAAEESTNESLEMRLNHQITELTNLRTRVSNLEHILEGA